MAAGDFFIKGNTGHTSEIPDAGSDLLLLWDTDIDSEGSGISYSAGVFTLGETGRFLVLVSEYYGTTDTTGNERINAMLSFYLDGTQLKEGRSTGYIRKTGGAQEFINFSAAIIEVTSTTGTADELETRIERIDNSTAGTVDRIASRSKVCILKLDDAWGYGRYESSAAFTPSATDDTRNTADIGSTVEQDSPFTRTGNVVDIATNNLVLAIYGFYNDDTDTLSGRTEMQGVLDLAGAEVPGSWSQTYGPRVQDDTNWGGMCNVSLLEPTSGDDLTLMLVSREDADEDWFATLQLVELPSAAEAIIVERATAAGDYNAAGTDFAWQSNPYIDTDAFTHTTGQANVDVDNAGDYLGMYSLGTHEDAGVSGTRATPAGILRVEPSGYTVGASSSYNRNTANSTHPTLSGAGLLPGLDADDSITVRANRIGTDTTTMAGQGGMAIIRLSSLFPPPASTASPPVQRLRRIPHLIGR